jgi:uncharacterized protein
LATIETIEALEALYGAPGQPAVAKVTSRLTPGQRAWIERSRFCVLSTVGPEGTDGSPRGDDGPVVRVADDRTLFLPDWRGNNRIDSLRNIVRDGRVSLIFLIPGSNTAMRVNGSANLRTDPDLLAGFEKAKKLPRCVIAVRIAEVYPQCARALMRAELWSAGDQAQGLPGIGDMLREASGGGIDGAAYDAAWPARAKTSMW